MLHNSTCFNKLGTEVLNSCQDISTCTETDLSQHVYAYGWKTVRAFCFFFEYCSLSWGWGGVGWGGMLTFLVLRTGYIAMLLRSLGSLTTWHFATLLRSLVWVGVGVGWGGGHVNVPCTSYMIYCHVAKISGIAYYVTCCYAAEISGVGWGWVGWGGMLTFLVLRTWYIAMLLRSLGSLTTWHVATLLRCHAIPALLAVAFWVPYWQLAVEDSFHTDGSLSRRRVLNKIWASTSDAHDVYLDLSKINRFCIHFFKPKFSYPKSSEEHFIL